MSARPRPTGIYHITHVENLASIALDGALLSDVEMIAREGPDVEIGMSSIKQRRLDLPVKCHPGDTVGEYVPFYFCPRSVMLYLIYMGNHPELSYRGGQGQIVHLHADLDATVAWAQETGARWAFSLANAGARYTEFRDDMGDLGEVDWRAVAATDFRDPTVKENKQAELLVRREVSWGLVQRIGVRSEEVRERALTALADADHAPPVDVVRDWYF